MLLLVFNNNNIVEKYKQSMTKSKRQKLTPQKLQEATLD